MKALITTAMMALLMVGMAFAACVDSDNGALSYAAGNVNENGTIYNDYCLQNGNVMEFTCVDNASVSEEMPCKRGCGINWQGLGACKPTSGGRGPSFGPSTTSTSSSSVESYSSESDNIVVDEPSHVPEFSTVAAGVALISSGAAYMLMRRKN